MINENILAKGEVILQVFENEKLIETFHEKNLVVTLGKTNVTRLLGGDAAGKAITKVSVGDNNTGATVADNAISNAFVKALTGVSYPDAQSVLFSFDIDNSEANGLTIREFGLLNDNGVLFARKVRGTDIVKTNAIRLVGTWKISIV